MENPENLSEAESEASVWREKRKVAWLKRICLVVAGLVVVKIILFFVALPKPTVDYVARYNELTKPADFKPEDNAAEYYLKANELYDMELVTEIPANLFFKFWGEEAPRFSIIDPNDIHSLKEWVLFNQPVLEQIRLAVLKPYCWIERESADKIMSMIDLYEITNIGNLTDTLILSAKIHALEGDFQSATEDLLVCYRVGQHQCGENLLVLEQVTGLSRKHEAIEAGFEILSYAKPTAEDLRYFQESMEACFKNDPYRPGLEAEKLVMYDTVQRTFLNWAWGINKLSFRLLIQHNISLGYKNPSWINAFTGPSRDEVLDQIERLFVLYDQFQDKTPWQIHHNCLSQLNEIKAIQESSLFKRMFASDYIRLFTLFQESRSETEALITVLAVMRYEADRDRLPGSLEELVLNGYIDPVPKDPYSDGSLVYTVKNYGFLLYSVGADFADDGGEPIVTEVKPSSGSRMMGLGMGMFDTVSTKVNADGKPVRIEYKDILYWPVKREMEKELHIKQEKLPGKDTREQSLYYR